MKCRQSYGLWLIALLLVLPIATTSCKGRPPEAKPTIRLAENPWSGSSVNVHVARIILREKLGYPVEIIAIDEYAQWEKLAKGGIHACLEVWPSGHVKDITEFIDKRKAVENIGLLGVVGKIGWYMPTYVVQSHPALATWEGFRNPGLAGLFRTAKTGDKGRFLSGDPSWVQYDRDIIRNLGLNLMVLQAGSEKAVLSELEAAYRARKPVLFYFWTPHYIHAKYRLTEVKLPSYSDACYSKAAQGGIDCAYPPDILIKVGWPGLKGKAPDAYELLRNMNYTNKDQIEMLALVELYGKTAEEAARIWIEKNKRKWASWLPMN